MYKGSMQKRYIDNYKDQASKLEMENYLEADIHSYQDLRNRKMLGIQKDKTLYIFNESTAYFMYICCPTRSNLVNEILYPLKDPNQ